MTFIRRHPGLGHALHGDHHDTVEKILDPAYFRGRVFGNEDDDDFDPGNDDDMVAEMNDQKSDCCTLYDLWRFSRDDFECSPLNEMDPELPATVVCFYPEAAKNDQYARVDPEMARQLLKQLRHGGSAYGFIDLGAGLGAYSLLAASREHSVVAVEANSNNLARFHKATKLGRYERYITLLSNKIGSSRDEVEIIEDKPKVS